MENAKLVNSVRNIYAYTGKYKGHSHLDEYIKSSNLNQNYRNVFEAINDFEKHIAFDKNNYVFHRNWGVGQIKKLEKAGVKETPATDGQISRITSRLCERANVNTPS